LSLNDKKVMSIMTPMKDVVSLAADQIIDHKLMDRILASGYSRFPVHEPGNPNSFIGLLLIKKLIQYDPEDRLPVNALPLSILPEASPKINCFQALDYFQTGRAHLLLITMHPGEPRGAIGVVTLEDIIEEIIAEEIVDETDQYEDMHTKRRAKRQSTAAVMRGIVEREKRRYSDSLPNTPLPTSTSHTMSISSSLTVRDRGERSLSKSPKLNESTPVESTKLLPSIDESASAYDSSVNATPKYGTMSLRDPRPDEF